METARDHPTRFYNSVVEMLQGLESRGHLGNGRGIIEPTSGNTGVNPEIETIACCRTGERFRHKWFVLRFLLGLPSVKNYDGSSTEYGYVVGVPIERRPVETMATA